MHEWALAEAIVKLIENSAVENRTNRVDYVEITLGELQQVDEEILLYAFNELLTILKNEKNIEVVKYQLVKERAEFKCNRCSFIWSPDVSAMPANELEMIHFIPETVHSFISCPRCGSHDFEIIRGRDLSVRLTHGTKV
ncbi:MAG: hydrogenase nickel incorporation protein HypA [Ignisphaera sp.]|nr:hydrogenase nickel incorporation protein HypA [Ignisphaera sp.]MCX8167868.1 hydrogenase nickel incorporation protein HypA [Ignisphaera sp.]MDW8085491.1 hydrogenase nickel incorporation protein HypA [Ignisphaera sp.]